MIIILFSLLCIGIAIYWYRKTKFLCNPVTVMFAIWGIILPVSIWGFYGTSIPSNKVYFIIFIGLISFLVGATLGNRTIKLKVGNKSITNTNTPNYKFNYTLLYILGIIAVIYYFRQFIIIFGYLRSGYGYDYIRTLATSEESVLTSSSTIFNTIRVFISTPVTYLIIAIFPIEFFNKHKHKLLLYESATLMVLYALTTGGRSVILWLVYYIICMVFFLRGKFDRKKTVAFLKKYMIWIILFVAALIIFLLQMTFSRKGNDTDLLKQIYVYFVCELQNFDYHIGVVDNSQIYGFGISSFYGLLYPIMYILRVFGINLFTPNVVTIYNMSFNNLEAGVNIGGGIRMNAYVTMFYQPYLDGRYIGVIIILLIYGFVVGRFFYSTYYKSNKKSLLIYLLFFQQIMSSMVRFYFTRQAQAMCFILAFLVIIKCSEDDKDNIEF